MENIVLASNSPRRKEILEKEGYDFDVMPSNYNEKICDLNYSSNLVEYCAYSKAFEVKNRLIDENALVVGADTVVVLDNVVLGKPQNTDEAFNMLKSLSDKTHFVATAICLIKGNSILKDTEKTYVTFRKLTDEEILNYIKTRNPLDKAGSYGIQDIGFDFYTSIRGNIDNVIGFPMTLFKKMLLNI